MPLVLPNQGLPSLLRWMLKSAIVGVPDLVFTLWTNDITPDQETVYDDLVIATFGGFQEGNLTRAGWSNPVVVDGEAVSVWGVDPISYTVTQGPQTVYGWAGYNPDTLDLVLIERFDVERTPGVGQTLQIVPQFKLGTWVPCP